MAGFYPDVPGPRIAYDRDGSMVITYNYSNSTTTEWTTIQKQEWNDEDESGPGAVGISSLYHSGWFTIIFPEPRNIVGYFKSGTHHNAYGIAMQTSLDTTNGVDGNWTAVGNQLTTGSTWPNYRSLIQPVSWNSIKAVRLQMGNENWNEKAFHIYGGPSSVGGSDRLRIWHPALDEPLDDINSADGAYLDWGDVVRGTTADRTFRIKNDSVSLTANSINISSEVLHNANPSLLSQVVYSDGGPFAASLSITTIGPGSISPVISVRRNTLANAAFAVWTVRTLVEPGSWS